MERMDIEETAPIPANTDILANMEPLPLTVPLPVEYVGSPYTTNSSEEVSAAPSKKMPRGKHVEYPLNGVKDSVWPPQESGDDQNTRKARSAKIMNDLFKKTSNFGALGNTLEPDSQLSRLVGLLLSRWNKRGRHRCWRRGNSPAFHEESSQSTLLELSLPEGVKESKTFFDGYSALSWSQKLRSVSFHVEGSHTFNGNPLTTKNLPAPIFKNVTSSKVF